MSIATLPMYDWPGRGRRRSALGEVATALRDHGFDPPAVLDRSRSLDDRWLDPDLLVGQTCGLPLVLRLESEVTVIGAFDHNLPATSPATTTLW